MEGLNKSSVNHLERATESIHESIKGMRDIVEGRETRIKEYEQELLNFKERIETGRIKELELVTELEKVVAEDVRYEKVLGKQKEIVQLYDRAMGAEIVSMEEHINSLKIMHQALLEGLERLEQGDEERKQAA